MRSARRRRRRSQTGQVLILALAFIAFFGVTIAAVLRVADVPAQQHRITETTATTDAGSEGGAAFGAAEAARSTGVVLTCSTGNSGQLTMQGGAKANYTVNACNPGGASSTSGAAQSCLLCLLNQTPPSSSAATVVFNANRAVTTSGGNDFINGSIASGTTLTANPAGAHIYAFTGATTSGCTCSPSPVITYSPNKIADPLATAVAPSPVAIMPLGCTSWSPSAGCTASFSGGNNTVHPGLWASLQTTGNANLTFAAGTYVFSGGLNIAGNGTIDGTSGVTLYLACANYGSAGTACPVSGGTGGSITISGNGSESFTAPSSGSYANIVLLADPHLLDPSGVTSCLGGSGCLLSISGNGASFTGTQDLRSGGATFQGNGGDNVIGGRFIANSLVISVSGHAAAGLTLSGPGTISTSNCGVFDDAVSSTGVPGTGRAIIQSQCGSARGVIDFNYSP
ncbi:MAG TPA: hypothetical protein VF155_07270 [Candidatus Dormibacteraeota bacterium]